MKFKINKFILFLKMNLEQQHVFDTIIEWVNTPMSKRTRIFNISGAGGTGKTEICKYLVDYFKTTSIIYQVCTPTNKAAGVLEERGLKNVSTIHTAFNLKMKYNDNGKLTLLGDMKLKELFNNFMIIDEASMLSNYLYKIMINRGYFYICFGDRAQLPPIEDKLVSESIIYRKHPPQYELTTVVRNTESTLNTLRDLILNFKSASIDRVKTLEKISSPNIQFISQSDLVNAYCNQLHLIDVPHDPHNCDICFETKTKFCKCTQCSHELCLDCFHSLVVVKCPFCRHNEIENKEEPNGLEANTIIICYRNKTRDSINYQIRQRLFEHPENEYSTGEQIIWVQYFLNGKFMRHPSDTDKVIHVSIQMEYCEYTKETYKVWKLNLKGGNTIYKIHPDSLLQFTNDFNTKKKQIKTNSFSKELWQDHYDYYYTFHAPITYNYCITIHSAQGSEYDTVFVNESDFMWLIKCNKKPDFRGQWNIELTQEEKIITRLNYLKLLYVGASRMKKECYVCI